MAQNCGFSRDREVIHKFTCDSPLLFLRGCLRIEFVRPYRENHFIAVAIIKILDVVHILRRPQVAQADIDTALNHLDSIAEDIRREKVSFEDAVLIVSDDKNTRNNHGILSNTRRDGENTTRFEMRELSSFSPELARVVEGLETGEISKPFQMINTKGATVCAIAKLKNRLKTHRANIAEDFQVLRGIVEEKKKEEVILNWIKEKQKSTYVRINENWRDCDFQYPGWVK